VIFCLGNYSKQLFKWDFQVQLKPGANSVTLGVFGGTPGKPGSLLQLLRR
jgi:hypothetical protein